MRAHSRHALAGIVALAASTLVAHAAPTAPPANDIAGSEGFVVQAEGSTRSIDAFDLLTSYPVPSWAAGSRPTRVQVRLVDPEAGFEVLDTVLDPRVIALTPSGTLRVAFANCFDHDVDLELYLDFAGGPPIGFVATLPASWLLTLSEVAP